LHALRNTYICIVLVV